MDWLAAKRRLSNSLDDVYAILMEGGSTPESRKMMEMLAFANETLSVLHEHVYDADDVQQVMLGRIQERERIVRLLDAEKHGRTSDVDPWEFLDYLIELVRGIDESEGS